MCHDAIGHHDWLDLPVLGRPNQLIVIEHTHSVRAQCIDSVWDHEAWHGIHLNLHAELKDSALLLSIGEAMDISAMFVNDHLAYEEP